MSSRFKGSWHAPSFPLSPPPHYILSGFRLSQEAIKVEPEESTLAITAEGQPAIVVIVVLLTVM